jgi:hypothetical protein
LLDNEISENEGFFLTWDQRDKENNIKEIELIPNGKNINVTDSNKHLYVEKVYFLYLLNFTILNIT